LVLTAKLYDGWERYRPKSLINDLLNQVQTEL
jgi:hypothetical protein